MALIIKLLFLAAIHIVLFVCYPDTGPRGNIHLAVSLIFWSAAIIFFGGSVKILKLAGSVMLFLFYLALFLAMGATTALTMPQADKSSVFSKLKRQEFPTIETMRRGLTRFGVKLDKKVRKKVKAADSSLEDAVDSAVDKLKGD